MVLLNLRFTRNGLARNGASKCPLRSSDEIAMGTCAFRRRGDVVPVSFQPDAKGDQLLELGAAQPQVSDEAHSVASTPTTSPNINPAAPNGGSAFAGADGGQGGGNAHPDATQGFSMDIEGASTHAFGEAPLMAPWDIIPSSAAAVPCDHGGLPNYDEIPSYMRLEEEEGDCGAGGAMDMDDCWGSVASAESSPKKEVLGPVRQEHKGYPDPNGVRNTQEQDVPQLRRPGHRGYPDPAEQERFMQHVGEQFLKYYPTTYPSAHREEAGAREEGVLSSHESDMAAFGQGWSEQAQDMGGLQEQGHEAGAMGCWDDAAFMSQ